MPEKEINPVKKLPTINLQGNEYVLVKDRVMAFHELYPKGYIHTEVTLHGNTSSFALVKAFIVPYAAGDDSPIMGHPVFTGHSAGQIDEEKSLEKLETVAVGRALAFLGIGVIESIASADELVAFTERTTPKAPLKSTGLKPCDKDGGEFVLKKGKFGEFFACSNYPACKRTLKLEDAAQWSLLDKKEF